LQIVVFICCLCWSLSVWATADSPLNLLLQQSVIPNGLLLFALLFSVFITYLIFLSFIRQLRKRQRPARKISAKKRTKSTATTSAAQFEAAMKKGRAGEKALQQALRQQLSKKHFILSDIVLRATDGSTTQIDLIVLSENGIFVIEVKNYNGWIFGKENDKEWTQSFNETTKYTFQNPIRQNYKHVKAVQLLTGLDNDVFKSLVVFVGGSRLKTKLPDTVMDSVEECVAYIQQQTETVFSKAKLLSIKKEILENKLASDEHELSKAYS